MTQRILITGAAGLVGCRLRPVLETLGFEVDGIDSRAAGAAQGDVRDRERVRQAVTGCDGIIHLAAVSRVVWAERDPALCWATNVGGVNNVLAAAAASKRRPWVIFASSREVYGQAEHLPVTEDAPLCPVNIYGRAKAEGERLTAEARAAGLRTAVVRLSNVFGSTSDHADRVVPAFARAAVQGKPLRVDGAEHTFDFTHVDDVACGLAMLSQLLTEDAAAPPPVHFVTGIPTTLGQLAEQAITLAESSSRIQHAPPRSFDVARFVGSPARARRLLGWTPRVALADGLAQLIEGFRGELSATKDEELV